MREKQDRLQLIVDLIKNNSIGSQAELLSMLNDRGISVTQATLSRDLRALHISKVGAHGGGYIYIVTDSNDLLDASLLHGAQRLSGNQVGFISLEFSGNIAVIKTRNGYATGLAYDIDMSRTPQFLGTIAGADTVFVIMREGVTHDEARAALSHLLPIDNQ